MKESSELIVYSMSTWLGDEKRCNSNYVHTHRLHFSRWFSPDATDIRLGSPWISQFWENHYCTIQPSWALRKQSLKFMTDIIINFKIACTLLTKPAWVYVSHLLLHRAAIITNVITLSIYINWKRVAWY